MTNSNCYHLKQPHFTSTHSFIYLYFSPNNNDRTKEFVLFKRVIKETLYD